jgi:hypothetical protein
MSALGSVLVALLLSAPASDAGSCDAQAAVAYAVADALQGETPPDAAWEDAYSDCLETRSYERAGEAALAECYAAPTAWAEHWAGPDD